MSDKDFLSGLVKDDKPESFKEEERIPVKKDLPPIKPWMIAVPIVVLVLIVFLIWFFIFRANIELPNFVGKTREDVGKWVTQYNIETSGIIFDESYSMEYDDGIIMSQTIEGGTKVKNDVKINFGLSLGPDPDEVIEVPSDLEEMTNAEIQAWIDDNKLLNTKVITAFSNTVPENEVISIDFRNCDRTDFTRGCTLNINVSKGQAPAGTVVVEDFKNKDLSTVQSWANQNRVELDVTEKYSSDVAVNMVISQSVAANQTIGQGETLTIVVSKGEGVTVPDFSTMTKSEVKTWTEDNASVVTLREVYSDTTDDYVIEQSVAAGEQVGTDDKLRLTVNLGSYFYLSDVEAPELVGGTYFKLFDWCEDMKEYGINAKVDNYGERTAVYSKEYDKGEIVSVKCYTGDDGPQIDCNGRLPLNVRFDIVISQGRGLEMTLDPYCTTVFDMVDFFAKNNIPFSVENKTDFEKSARIEDSEGHRIYQYDFLYSDQEYVISSGSRVDKEACALIPPIDDGIDQGGDETLNPGETEGTENQKQGS